MRADLSVLRDYSRRMMSLVAIVLRLSSGACPGYIARACSDQVNAREMIYARMSRAPIHMALVAKFMRNLFVYFATCADVTMRLSLLHRVIMIQTTPVRSVRCKRTRKERHRQI